MAAALEKNTTVTHIDLIRNKIGVEGAKAQSFRCLFAWARHPLFQALAAALEKNATVAHIQLNVNKIGKEGAKAQSVVCTFA